MNIERATDAAFVNRVANDPSVLPYSFPSNGTDIDLSAVVENPNNLVLQSRIGSMVFIQHTPGLYEAHIAVLPEGRSESLKMATTCIDYLFTKTNAFDVFVRCVEGNIGALALTKACGARHEHRAEQSFFGKQVTVDLYSGRIQDWIKTAPGLVERGREFRARMHTKAHQAGVDIDHLQSNEWQDRHLGAVAGMLLGGQPVKGYSVYNRWAAMALAAPMRAVCAEPLIFDTGYCLLKLTGSDFEVIPCLKD